MDIDNGLFHVRMSKLDEGLAHLFGKNKRPRFMTRKFELMQITCVHFVSPGVTSQGLVAALLLRT